jgi:hypothetical protein
VALRKSGEAVGQRDGMGWDGVKQEKMLVLWLRINKSPKAKQVSNIHRIATAYSRRRRRRHFLLTNALLGATTAQSVKRPGCGLSDRKECDPTTRTRCLLFSTSSELATVFT